MSIKIGINKFVVVIYFRYEYIEFFFLFFFENGFFCRDKIRDKCRLVLSTMNQSRMSSMNDDSSDSMVNITKNVIYNLSRV